MLASSGQIVRYPSPFLRSKSKTIYDDIGIDKLIKIKNSLVSIMDNYGGVGLSGPQIGLLYKIFVIRTEKGIKTYINPLPWIKSQGSVSTESNEGCLSMPGRYFKVERQSKISVLYENIYGEAVAETLENEDACAFQHEYDHLMGILLIDKGVEISEEEILGSS